MGKVGIIVSVIVGIVAIIAGAVLGWVILPDLKHSQIIENIELRKGSDQYNRFKYLPMPFTFKVYMFNVKNSKEIEQGARPEVEEQGPYIYKQFRYKTILKPKEDDENGTISYTEKQHYEFDWEASTPYSESDMITVINPALNSAFQHTLAAMINKDWPNMFKTDSLFLNISVKDFLFDGYTFCDIQSISCDILGKIKTKNIKKVSIDGQISYSFTFFNHKNASDDGEYEINNGMDKIEDVGLISKWRYNDFITDVEDYPVWGNTNTTCNKVSGRDSVIYPPFIKNTDKITIFNSDICRTVSLEFTKELPYKDVTAYRFALPKETLEAPNEEKDTMCYCLNKTKILDETNCLEDGAMELFPCYGAPIVLTWPHLMWADKQYKNYVIGMKPDENRHITYVDLEPNTGTPLRGNKRVQFNMFVYPEKKITYLKNFTTSIIPILWLDEEIEINNDLYGVLYDSFVIKIILMDVIKWGLIVIGVVILGATIVHHFLKKRSNKRAIETT